MKPKRAKQHGGKRQNAGRRRREGWKPGTAFMPDWCWEKLSLLAEQRQAEGEKNVSVRSIIGELIANALEARQR